MTGQPKASAGSKNGTSSTEYGLPQIIGGGMYSEYAAIECPTLPRPQALSVSSAFQPICAMIRFLE